MKYHTHKPYQVIFCCECKNICTILFVHQFFAVPHFPTFSFWIKKSMRYCPPSGQYAWIWIEGLAIWGIVPPPANTELNVGLNED